jgi:hypothetical protein
MWFGLIPADLPGSWPYSDLVLRSPNCPRCNRSALLLVGAQLCPRAFCANDACQAFSWDPTDDASALVDPTLTEWTELDLEWLLGNDPGRP